MLNAAFVYSKRNIYNKIICRKIFKKLGNSVSLFLKVAGSTAVPDLSGWAFGM